MVSKEWKWNILDHLSEPIYLLFLAVDICSLVLVKHSLMCFYRVCVCVCVFAGCWDEEALPHSEQSVQTFPGDADEDAQRVSAVLRSLYKTQRAQKTFGETNSYMFFTKYKTFNVYVVVVGLKYLVKPLNAYLNCCLYKNQSVQMTSFNFSGVLWSP